MERLRTPKDLQIPVSYGNLHALQWGPEDGVPVLAIPDWLDNAASFQPLAQRLDPSIRLVSLNLVGHGSSARLPKGFQYSHQQFVHDMGFILDYLNWDHCGIIAHGLGVTMALYYAGLCPDVCDCVVSLSIADTVSTSLVHVMPTLFQYAQDEALVKAKFAFEELDSAVSDLVDATGGSLDGDSARLLLKAEEKAGQSMSLAVLSRCLRVFTMSDARKNSLTLQNTMTLYKGPLLMVSVKDWRDADVDDMLTICEDFFKSSCEPFSSIEVEGTHHVHMNNPAALSEHVNNFLLNFGSSPYSDEEDWVNRTQAMSLMESDCIL
ncbi:serine hydrolase-like protein [Ornithodoros turicata]|uniref:Putative hydrolase/acyltransferase alpha/beta hydrolase superfamily n=1 Tax=Ornithodoros turicata TaxID=34597 RepID=A0A2R5LK15_9ACAR